MKKNSVIYKPAAMGPSELEINKVDPRALSQADPWFWAYWNKINLQSSEFKLEGHEYLIEPMQYTGKKRAMKKGAQMGFSEAEILRAIHGLLYGYYPSGVLYLFPTSDDVIDFSKSRFSTLIEHNPTTIGKYVGNISSAELKKIGTGNLYLRGARVTQKIEGTAKAASKLRSIPVDKIVFDEVDLMDPDMINMALERFSHSQVQEEVYLSTPTIPDFGIDQLYTKSDQRRWMIKCDRCNRECCLEDDFPSCVKFRDGKAYRACAKCGGELLPSNGRWVPMQKSEMAGWWISQLNSMYVDPGKILDLFENPPNGNLQEVYNSKLAMAYIAAENRLSMQDVYACCGSHVLAARDHGPCAMGVDVGKTLHVVVGKKLSTGKRQIVWMGEVPEFEDLYELIPRFNLRCAGVDYMPETRKAREFQHKAITLGCPTYLIFNRDKVKEGEKRDEGIGVVDLPRTEYCDLTHINVVRGIYIIPRRCPQVDEYARQMSNIAKILEEDERRGTKIYRYRKLGPDHFRHATNYFEVAVKNIEEATDNPMHDMLKRIAEERKEYDPLTFGLA